MSVQNPRKQAEQRAKELLLELRMEQVALEQELTDAEQELDAVRMKHEGAIARQKEQLKATEKRVKDHAKKHADVLFEGRDRVDLGGVGALLRSCRQVVRRAKAVTVELLKGLDYHDGIRVEEKVDWDAIEKWPDAKLIAIGAERKEKVEYGWELAEPETEGAS